MSVEIHTLIHSLTQSEKRYFKLHAAFMFPSEEKKFMELFDLILKQKSYNESFIKSKIHSAHFAQLKQQLFTKILECLRIYQQGNSARLLIDSNLADYNILRNKNLLMASAKAIKRAETIAVNYELYSELIAIKQAETELLVALGDIKKLEKHLDELRKHIPQWMLLIDDFIQIEKTYILFVKLNKETDFIRSEQEQKKLDQFITAPILDDVKRLTSQRTRIYYYYIKGLYFFLSGKLNKSKEAFMKQIVEFESNKYILQNSIHEYSKALANNCLLCNKALDENQFYIYFEKLNNIKTGNTLLSKQIDYWKYLLQLNFYVSKRDMNKALLWISKWEKELNNSDNEDINKIMVTETNYIMFDTALTYMCNGQFSKANRLINNFINNSDADLKSDHYHLARIVHLFIQCELGNDDFVLNEYKLVERHLKAQNRFYKFEKCCLNFVSRLIMVNSAKEKKQTWKAFYEELKTLSESRFENNGMMNFDLMYWAETKAN